MKITLYTTDSQCNEIATARCAHISMFERNEITIHFTDQEEQLKFVQLCIKFYVLFKCQGANVTIIPESNNYQRVRFRFDS